MPAYRRLKLDQALWGRLCEIHAGVYGSFIWTSDERLHGQREHWDRPVVDEHGYLHGDCDDFAIECDHRAREVGLPADAMCYYGCTAETGAGHLVLGVHTDRGVIMLDNRQRQPVLADDLDRAGYANWKRPQPGHPITDRWQTVSFAEQTA